MADTGSGGLCRLSESVFKVDRAHHSERRVAPAPVVDSFDPVANSKLGGCLRRWDGGKRTNGVKRHIAVDVSGLLLAVVVTAACIQDRDAAHRLLAALRGSFSSIRLVWADGGYPGRLLGWAKGVLALRVEIIKRLPAPAAPQSTCGPTFGWWSARSAGSSSTVVACVPTRPDPTTTRPSSTSP